MRVLLVGVGGVGEAIAAISKPRPWMELMVLADYNKKRASRFRPSWETKNASRWSSWTPINAT